MRSNRQHAALLLLALPLLLRSAQDPAGIARKALDLLLASQYAGFSQFLSVEARAKLGPDFLRDRVGPELQGFGQLESVGAPVTAKAGTNDLISFPVRFSNTSVSIQLTVNESGRIAGLFFRPVTDPLPATWKRPAYSKPELFRERPVTIGNDDWKLNGTLTVPAGKGTFPALVLVHGPGPNDRDESIFSSRIFADLAEGLASRGIVVLRYEKRTKAYGPQMSAMAYTLREETIDDAVRAAALLRQQPEVNTRRIFVLGHSLGGYAVPRIARQDGNLAGAILLAANARHIEDISVAQTEYMLAAKGGASPDEQRRMELMKGEASRVRSLTPGKDNPAILLGLPVEYFLDLKGYDAPAEAKRLGLPLLILQGGRDFQVTKADFELWQSSLGDSKNARFHTYPMLNHLFITGDGPSSPAEYRKGGNLSTAVIDDITAWMTSLP